MLSRDENERLTRVGPGTPMGTLMRRYWIPVAYSKQLAKPDDPPMRVKLLCENLIAFRDTTGRVGLVDERCPHRMASLYFGRNEECGLRCVYHGIKFDVDGNCVDVPCLPPGTPDTQLDAIKKQIRLKSYPCLERGGLIWTFMGPPELRPDFPDLEWIGLPPEQRFDTRHIQECNWLQAVEGGYDAPHLTFLHRGDQTERRNSRMIVPSYYEVVPTDFGFVVGTGRDFGGANIEWNINVFLMPFHKIISSVPHGAHMWVPIDDDNTMLYSISFNPHKPFTPEDLAEETGWLGIHTENVPGTDCAVANKSNDYLIDRALQASGKSFTGLIGFGVQDCAIQESMGPIVDRSIEHLLNNDLAIVKIRRLLLETLKELEGGGVPPGLNPASHRVRSTRYTAPRSAKFVDEVWERMRASA